MIPKILFIGLGGIGSNLLDLVVPALNICHLKVDISIMDDDIVEEDNIGHQRFTSSDIGTSKALSLSRRLSDYEHVKIIPIEEKLSKASQLHGYDLIIVAVDRMAPRQLVHSSTTEWLDLRCQGDGYVVIDNQTSKAVIDSLPGNNKPTSCQIDGSKDFQNIEFGFSMCATIGAQWILQKVRILNGYNTSTPTFRMGSISDGELCLPGGV